MATTTNYGWTTPDDTALVKDGASAIRTLGSSVDTTTKNLNPETTLGDLSFRSSTSNVNTRIPIGSSGQHLTVVAGVPAWATASDQTPLTTKGDLLGFSTLDARIPIGANATVLTADSSESLGLKWATPAAGGGMTSIASGSLSGSSLSLTSISGSYKNLQLVLRSFVTSSEDYMEMKFNNLSTSIYDVLWVVNGNGSASTAASTNATKISINYNSLKQSQTGDTFAVIDIYNYANTTTQKNVRGQASYIRGNNTPESVFFYANADVTSAIDRIDIVLSTTFSAGTYILYGVN